MSIKHAFDIFIIIFEFQTSEIETGPRQLWQLCQITFPCLAKLELQSAANDFRSPHHHSKTYLLVGFITIIKPCIFSIHHLARVSSLAWVMNGAAMASIYFFLMNYLLSLINPDERCEYEHCRVRGCESFATCTTSESALGDVFVCHVP